VRRRGDDHPASSNPARDADREEGPRGTHRGGFAPSVVLLGVAG
jgi:hypothetical protein